MMINSSGKSPFEIRDSTGKEFEEIYDNQGRLLFKNWNEIQGSLLLTFKSYADYIKDYRIYGTSTPTTSAGLPGVGVRTENTVDGYKIPVNVNGKNLYTPITEETPNAKLWPLQEETFMGQPVYRGDTDWSGVGNEIVLPLGYVTMSIYYRIPNSSTPAYLQAYLYFYTTQDTDLPQSGFVLINDGEWHRASLRAKINTLTPRRCRFEKRGRFDIDISCMQIETGSTATEYEPYSNMVTPIYIGSEPLYADEYISFSEQKIYRKINNILTPTEPPVRLPALQTLSGTKILTADTTVQPSMIYLKGKIKSLATHMLIDSENRILISSDNYQLVTKEQ